VEAQQALAPAEVVVHHGNEKRRPRAHNLRQSSPTMVILGSAPIAHMNPALTLALLVRVALADALVAAILCIERPFHVSIVGVVVIMLL